MRCSARSRQDKTKKKFSTSKIYVNFLNLSLSNNTKIGSRRRQFKTPSTGSKPNNFLDSAVRNDPRIAVRIKSARIERRVVKSYCSSSTPVAACLLRPAGGATEIGCDNYTRSTRRKPRFVGGFHGGTSGGAECVKKFHGKIVSRLLAQRIDPPVTASIFLPNFSMHWQPTGCS